MAELTTVNISIPVTLREFVDERMRREGFANVSEYFRHLVREDQKRDAQERLEAKLLEGLDSGEPIAATPEWWDAQRRRLADRARKRGA